MNFASLWALPYWLGWGMAGSGALLTFVTLAGVLSGGWAPAVAAPAAALMGLGYVIFHWAEGVLAKCAAAAE